VRLGRSPFAKLVETQLDLFEHDHRDVLDEIEDRLEAYNRADSTSAEELYGDYADAVDAAGEILADMRDRYARTVDDADGFVRAFNRAAARRLQAHPLDLERR
jgi:hypothetical protein